MALDRTDSIATAHVTVVARVLALVPATHRALRTVAVGRTTVRTVTALGVRVAQQPVRAQARKRSGRVFAYRRFVTRALFALVHVLALSAFQLVTVVTRTYAFMFVRPTIPVPAIYHIARA